MWHSIIDSPVGKLRLEANAKGISGLYFVAGKLTHGLEESMLSPDHPLLSKAERQLHEYFAGKRQQFQLPLAPQGTVFQLMAWKALSEIPFGQTISYGEQAKRVGDAKKARAVGIANGRNPIAIIIPCHRVIGSNGELTGFGGGLHAKSFLLEHERQYIRASDAA